MNDAMPQPSSALEQLVQRATHEFRERHSSEPDWVVAAPGRVNLIGEHTDYNDGFVLPMAIDKHVVIAARKVRAERIRIASQSVEGSVEVELYRVPEPGKPEWANYPKGVIAGFFERNIKLPGIDAVMVSDVPLGGGLSSSAAVEVATATLLEVASGTQLDSYDKARLCRKAEHEFAHVPCGIMDQFISVLGDPSGALLIDCSDETARVIPIADSSVGILVMNTNVRHNLASGEYRVRRQQCESAARKLGVKSLREATLGVLTSRPNELTEPELKRARHVISENERTLRAVAALREGELPLFGQLMFESHESLRMDFEVSCRELDVLVSVAHKLGERHGVLGARMTGGGFGGCTITLVKTARIEEVQRELEAEYVVATGLKATGFATHPVKGARRIA